MSSKSKYRNHFYISLFLHAITLTILVMSFDFNARNFVLENSEKNEIINAIVVDAAKIQKASPIPVSAAKVENAPKKILPPQPIIEKKVIPKKEPEITKPLETKSPERTIAIPDQRKKQLQKDLIQKQLLADLKQQTEKQKREKQKILEKAFEQEIKEHAAKSLQQQLLKEQNRLASAQAQKMRGIVDKYKALILQAIAQHWLVPNGVDKSLSSELLIRVAPGGIVLDVQLVKSSGDSSLDRSARNAVFKASPLPVPTDGEEFDPFRQFILKVKPQNILARDNGLG